MSIRVVDLEKKHPGASAPSLAGLSIEVPGGAVASVIGRSGAGKTTLLRCLSGLDPFDRGSIEVAGVVVGPSGVDDAAGRQRTLSALAGKVGLVFQAFELFPHLSVLDNCTLAPQKVRRRARAEAEEHALGPRSTLSGCSRRSASPTRRGSSPRPSRAGSGSAWPSPGRSPWSRASCSTTSPRAPSTPPSSRRWGARSAAYPVPV
jgi:ABC-type polar amino acid transport system ATPase subunit